ncbi:MAG: ankyrin repeat domain-containing protein, partial [Gammaproteobacteria bacterium]|nr:ankyrin repeat domain-containing protein [Gammaproteobacteria bacterium]
MSLSKKIIYGSDKEVIEFLKSNPELNVIDEYGYTPLIQTAIINSLPKAKILLDAGAEVDFPDLTGRTALFWAADNDNLELCNLCLKYHANPNAYSSGGQPILVMPLMKNHQEIKKLLVASGAKLDFAQDFLNAKLIGHGFELEGRADIVDTRNVFIEVELEG